VQGRHKGGSQKARWQLHHKDHSSLQRQFPTDRLMKPTGGQVQRGQQSLSTSHHQAPDKTGPWVLEQTDGSMSGTGANESIPADAALLAAG